MTRLLLVAAVVVWIAAAGVGRVLGRMCIRARARRLEDAVDDAGVGDMKMFI